jgi:hypothetical protein
MVISTSLKILEEMNQLGYDAYIHRNATRKNIG